jgi:hypothetical protein
MQTIIRTITGALLVLLVVAAPALAQTKNATATATVKLNATLELATVEHMTFPEAYASAVGYLYHATPARWDVTADQGVALNYSFALPTVLAAGAETLPIEFGNMSFRVACGASGANVMRYDPAAGRTGCQWHPNHPDPSIGSMNPEAVEEDKVRVLNKINAKPGTYTGNIVLTVTVP